MPAVAMEVATPDLWLHLCLASSSVTQTHSFHWHNADQWHFWELIKNKAVLPILTTIEKNLHMLLMLQHSYILDSKRSYCICERI